MKPVRGHGGGRSAFLLPGPAPSVGAEYRASRICAEMSDKPPRSSARKTRTPSASPGQGAAQKTSTHKATWTQRLCSRGSPVYIGSWEVSDRTDGSSLVS
eukprot:5408580-Prymnesium_polylepis.1